jgi:hypothetical protein
MARRAVMNESAKWRSARDLERTVTTRPGGRGGKSAEAFSDHEGVAAEDDGNVVMPAGEGAAFEVVEAEVAFQGFVHALGAPALFEQVDDLLFAHAAWQRREQEFAGLLFVFGPLGY